MSSKTHIKIALSIAIFTLFLTIYGNYFYQADSGIESEIEGQKVIFSIADGSLVSTPYEFKPNFVKIEKEALKESENDKKNHQIPDEKVSEAKTEKPPETIKEPEEIKQIEKPKTIKPQLAVMVRNLGLNDEITMMAIDKLPPQVAIGLSPYSNNLDYYAVKAKKKGHKVLLNLPMETKDYPVDDPGPHALLSALTEKQNKSRIEWLLSQTPNLDGFYFADDATFLYSANRSKMLMKFLEQGKFILVNNGDNPHLEAKVAEYDNISLYKNYRNLDSSYSAKDMIKEFDQMVIDAKNVGFTMASVGPYPFSIKVLERILQEITIELVEISHKNIEKSNSTID